MISMDSRIAVIGGLGFGLEGIAEQAETPFGKVMVRRSRLGDTDAVFVQRHGEGHLPPHKVNYRAILWAARGWGAKRVIAINNVGTLSSHPVGGLFLPSDFVEFTKCRINTFFEEKAVHIDMSQPYCPQIRSGLKEAMKETNIEASEGIYVCAEGPHLESPAQIRMMKQFGDVVGMTGYPEVVLARELGLCYASVCLVTNEACGIGAGTKLCISDIMEQVKSCSNALKEIISRAAKNFPEERLCPCKSSPFEAEL